MEINLIHCYKIKNVDHMRNMNIKKLNKVSVSHQDNKINLFLKKLGNY